MVAGLKAVEDKERGYAHPMDLRNKANPNSSDSVVDVLHGAVATLGGSLSARYCQTESAPFGTPPYCAGATCNAPMPFAADTNVIPFEEAAETVKKFLRRLQPNSDAAIVKTALCRAPQ